MEGGRKEKGSEGDSMQTWILGPMSYLVEDCAVGHGGVHHGSGFAAAVVVEQKKLSWEGQRGVVCEGASWI